MENDLISRQTAIDVLDAYQVMVENGEENPYSWARQRMHELPSEQPEIIRCKDCKWWVKDEYYDGLYRCANDGLIYMPDWFCADGERREE